MLSPALSIAWAKGDRIWVNRAAMAAGDVAQEMFPANGRLPGRTATWPTGKQCLAPTPGPV